jgi:hypothetical protein
MLPEKDSRHGCFVGNLLQFWQGRRGGYVRERSRTVFLNRLISRSVSSAPEEHKPETHGLEELLGILEARRHKGHAIEFLGGLDDPNEEKRKQNGIGHDFIRLKMLRIDEIDDRPYATLLIEYVDQSSRTFPVVDVESYKGRELSGEREERGATTAHVGLFHIKPGVR